MGKLIRFPMHRIRGHHRLAAAHVFGAFSDLEAIERAQLKLLAACISCTLLCLAALQLAL